MSFRMNSAQEKAILALVRSGDYAHPGEEEAIRLTTTGLPRESIRRVLDVGCGRGGTAHWFHRQGWGQVVGVDIDRESISYAIRTYPEVQFHECDAGAISQLSLAPFDMAYLFNSFYAFPEQHHAVAEIRRVCRDGARLMTFDYTRPTNMDTPAELGSEIGQPIVLETLQTWLTSSQWQPIALEDLTDHYVGWYEVLAQKIEEKEQAILELAGRDWYEYVLSWYSALRDALVARTLGGCVVHAVAI